MIAFDVQNNSHVAILISWWSSLTDDDRANLFYPTVHKLGPFLHYFETVQLMFAVDTQGLTVAAWTESMFDGALFSLYVRPDCRRLQRAWKEVEQAYETAFSVYPALVGQTRQPALHAIHLKMGYQFAGRLNHIFGGGPIFFYELDREHWRGRREAAKLIRGAKRGRREHQVTQGNNSNGHVRASE